MGACRAPACLWSPAVGSKDAGSGRVGGALCRGVLLSASSSLQTSGTFQFGFRFLGSGRAESNSLMLPKQFAGQDTERTFSSSHLLVTFPFRSE